jgi:hypothetical protein
MPQWRGPKSLVGGWVLSGTLFTRSGLPFSIVDSNAASVLAGFNYNPATSQQFIGGQLLATPTGGPIATGCDRSAVDLPCLSTTSFGPATSFAVGRRNGVFGPSFFNMDVSLMKNFALPHWESGRLGVGITAFNVLNHVNFDQPNGDIANPQFGLITSDISVPTSVFGSFLGGNASPRILQVNARLTF